MVIYAKKTMFGYKDLPDQSDISSDDFAVMPVSRYNSMITQIQDLTKETGLKEYNIKCLSEEARKNLNEAAANYEKKLEAHQSEYERLLAEKEEEITKLKQELQNAGEKDSETRMLNEKLLRISRERSNSDRGIQPKKEHDGYIVLRSEQWYDTVKTSHPEKGYERYSEEFLAKYNLLRTEVQNVDAWKTVIQTPYSTELAYNHVETIILEDLKQGVLENIGITGFGANTEKTEPEEEDWEEDNWEEDDYENNCYKYRLRADYRSGYWEADYYTLCEVRVSLDHYPPKKR